MKQSLFYKIYFAALAICGVLLVALLLWLNGWLKNFEATQPTYIVNTAVETYLQKDDVNGLLERYHTGVSPYEPDVDMNAIFAQKRQGRALTTASRKTEDGMQCVVSAGEDVLLHLQLKKQAETSLFGERYTLAGVVPADDMLQTVKIRMPSDAQVKINGVDLKAEDCITEENIASVNAFLKDMPIAGLQSATITGLSKAPTITAFMGETPLEVQEENGVYTVRQALPEAEVKTVNTFALEAAHAYAAYMQNDAYFRNISKYLKADTAFYDNVRTSEVTFVWQHDGYHFEQDSTTAVHKYHDSLYCLRVSFVHVLKLGNREYKDYFDQYVYVCKNADGMQVLDMQQVPTT